MPYSLIQLKSIVEIAQNGFHVSRAAKKLHTSQSAISKHLTGFETSLGTEVFTRVGKRLTGLTPEGENILKFAQRMLTDHDSIQRVGIEASSNQRCTLSLATTPTIARYLLPNTVKMFTHKHPDVHLHVNVEESDKAVDSVRLGRSEFAIVPVVKDIGTGLSVHRLTHWTRLLIGLPECPLFSIRDLTLEQIASEPIIAFETPTVSLRETFDRNELHPEYALTTSNPGVMKAYAAIGLGVAIVATPTFDKTRDSPLCSRDVSHLFPDVLICLVKKTESYHSKLQLRFLEYLQMNLPVQEQT